MMSEDITGTLDVEVTLYSALVCDFLSLVSNTKQATKWQAACGLWSMCWSPRPSGK